MHLIKINNCVKLIAFWTNKNSLITGQLSRVNNHALYMCHFTTVSGFNPHKKIIIKFFKLLIAFNYITVGCRHIFFRLPMSKKFFLLRMLNIIGNKLLWLFVPCKWKLHSERMKKELFLNISQICTCIIQ